MYESVGFNWNNRFKKKLKVYHPLYGNKIKKYIRNECSKKNNTFSFMLNQFDSNLYLRLDELMII